MNWFKILETLIEDSVKHSHSQIIHSYSLCKNEQNIYELTLTVLKNTFIEFKHSYYSHDKPNEGLLEEMKNELAWKYLITAISSKSDFQSKVEKGEIKFI